MWMRHSLSQKQVQETPKYRISRLKMSGCQLFQFNAVFDRSCTAYHCYRVCKLRFLHLYITLKYMYVACAYCSHYCCYATMQVVCVRTSWLVTVGLVLHVVNYIHRVMSAQLLAQLVQLNKSHHDREPSHVACAADTQVVMSWSIVAATAVMCTAANGCWSLIIILWLWL